MNLTSNLKKAFTLVELMAVLLIVTILGVLGTVSYSYYAKKSKTAEAFAGVNKMAKDQTTYYIMNKKFYWASANPGVNLYSPGPLYGKMYSSQTYYGSGFEVTGFPYPPGSDVQFNYEVNVGRTDASGNEIEILTGGAGTEFVIKSQSAVIHGWYLQPGAVGMYACSNAHMLSEYTNPVGKIQYNWAILMASRNFDDSNNSCTLIYKILDTDDHGNVRGGNPIISEHVGD